MSEKTLETMKSIAKANGLRIDKLDLFVFEGTRMAVGMTPSSKFVERLSRELQIDKETARGLAINLDKEIFNPIRESMRIAQEKNNKFEAVEQFDQSSGPSASVQTPEEQTSMDMPTDDEGAIDIDQYLEKAAYNDGGFESQVSAESGDVTLANPRDADKSQNSEAAKIDPNKSFKDILQEKIQKEGQSGSKDPYREPIE